jgi:hypothetical protein
MLLLQIILLGLLAAIAQLLNRRVNVNRYSMHGVYRNRLTRAFLGAARGADRRPDPFTQFDPADNIPLAKLVVPDTPRKLFPVLNMTLNLTAGAVASWAERKAMVFTATPLACGAPWLRPAGSRPLEHAAGAYVPTIGYAGLENPGANPDDAQGFTLATAMTISGAAVSPNWGYHSSPVTAFVMTLFNARLGAWLPNPAARLSAQEMNWAMPKRSLPALLGELLGAAGEDKPSIYLSDGGHFENLGLYEMLRRRCRRILVVDAGLSDDSSLGDLGRALRMAEIDMNITVEWVGQPRIGEAHGETGMADGLGYAVATIHYPEARDGEEGRLVYLKTCLPMVLPADLRAYADANPAFPHDTTLDQWFTESQFESYRRLGELQTSRITAGVERLTLDRLFRQAFEPYAAMA